MLSFANELNVEIVNGSKLNLFLKRTIEQTLQQQNYLISQRKRSTKLFKISFAYKVNVEVVSSGSKKYVAVISYRVLSKGIFEYKGDMVEGVGGNGTKVWYWFANALRTPEEIQEMVDTVAFFIHHQVPLDTVFQSAQNSSSASSQWDHRRFYEHFNNEYCR